MGKTMGETKHRRRRIPDTEATIATRIAGGAAFGATLGAVVGVPGAVIGGVLGGVGLGAAPYLVAISRRSYQDGRNGHNPN